MGYRARVTKPRTGSNAAGKKKEPAGGGARLVLENVRCFAHAVVPLDAKVTVIIGQNGSGKTSIAEAIASLAPGEDEGLDEFPLRRGEAQGSMALYGEGAEPIAQWTHPAGSPARRRGDQRVFVYGQYRALRPPPGRRPRQAIGGRLLKKAAARRAPDKLEDALRRSTTKTLFDFDEYLFGDLASYVALLEERSTYDAAARSAWTRLRAWLRALDERLGDVTIETQRGLRRAVFERAGQPLEITELSDGYRSVLAVVLDLVIRYTQIFSGLDDPLAGEALVVIDEIDLNLHPRWQRRVIDQLTTLFPGTRFVLTTHSPAVVQAAIDGRREVLVLHEKLGAPTSIRKLTQADLRRLDGAEVDSVLVDDALFDVASKYSPKYERIEERVSELGDKLEAGTGTARDRQILLGLLEDLRRLMVQRDQLEAKGPLMSEIARTQISMLSILDKQLSERPKKGGKRRDPAPTKRRQGAP
jgi:energy-coupling factor transporter ATP-binding protein EcfA2